VPLIDPAARTLICIALFVFGHAHAQNLLQNSTLDDDLDAWRHSLYVSHVDDDGWPALGAMRFTSDFCCTQAASQCVPVTGGASYELGAALKRGSEYRKFLYFGCPR